MVPSRYTFKNLRRAIGEPIKFVREFKRLYRKPAIEAQRLHFKYQYGEGIEVMNEDWDNLIILDACRYDYFKRHVSLPGNLKRKVSLGSSSSEFIGRNFLDEQFYDTVCISGNGHYQTEGVTNNFHYYNYVYDDVDKLLFKAEPDVVFDASLDAYRKYDDKRFIIHFLIPHAPYTGPKAEKIRQRLETEHNLKFPAFDPDVSEENPDSKTYNSLLHTFPDGYINDEEVDEIYTENLNIVLDYVENLLEIMDGKTVITSDHGELLGKSQNTFKKMFYPKNILHPGGLYDPELRLVPWLEIDQNERRRIKSEAPISKDDIDSETINKHLEYLGYK